MVTLKLPEQMVNVIAEALGEHKYRLAAPVIAEIAQQLNAQQKGPRLVRAEVSKSKEVPK